MKLRSLLMLGALMLGGCAVNPYGGTPAPVGEPDKPVTQPQKPVTQPGKTEPVPAPKPVAPTGLAVSMADAFLKSAEVQSIAGSSPVLLLMAPQNGTGEAFSTQPMAVAMIQRIQANSGFRFADPGQVAAITGQLEYQQGGMNPASLVRLGRQTGAGYMLYGDLVSEGSRYRLAMSLMDLKSGELLWNGSRSAPR
ncbi:penicillin-binding protein activator LpoB [Aeromonas taiwanensis]|uniref:Penicillin-binding protein activator LpoB n=2 Tax=Aeromonas taiwanensis TaxID=633417 RepID=A0A5F0KCY2_9GAMM|nr:penicillin-binding protein activator LpoB [Aeromonas taiwanensis]TFF77865.1 penicillin-binding protein activator LpoB [Aeromonas taiwanensis]TFF78318.1 penicillin-binding protein activator LpoB [Aeromonas taiwanensis]TFF82131.1 penicillin-binding protein activator LpoB [Aeromonas taiwanensis]